MVSGVVREVVSGEVCSDRVVRGMVNGGGPSGLPTGVHRLHCRHILYVYTINLCRYAHVQYILNNMYVRTHSHGSHTVYVYDTTSTT